MKKCLPNATKVSKEAKECVQECTSEFISFLTSEAAERCLDEKRKTINGEDILTAMMKLGFENYADVLKIYLTKYRVVGLFYHSCRVMLIHNLLVATVDGQESDQGCRQG